ncbi:MAG: T9SS type A sorting domain-containing protein [Bacteroidia bacterium]|nr:T9SS type A sorting domain-containing protein [Bacteroidia bacterium]
MKKKLLAPPLKKVSLFSIMLLFSGIALFGQDIQFPQAVISSGGGNSSSNAVNLTRWRIGQINVVTLPSAENIEIQASVAGTGLSEKPIEEWSVTVYPNPVNTLLKVHFDTEIRGKYTLEIYDLSGRKLMTENAQIILPGQVAEIDLKGLTSALYFLKVTPSAQGTQKVFKIFKQ